MLYKGSIEQEALNLLIAQKKIQEQEKELRTLITYTYGVKAYEEMLQMRRDIRDQREKAIWKQRRMKKDIFEGFMILLLIIAIGCLIIFLFAGALGKL